ncbi:hypothetical protein D3C72_1147530 [compost metagenome]
MHGGIGHEDGAVARNDQRNADDAVAGLGVDAAADILERRRIVAGNACYYRVRIAHRHHAGREMVAVVVDQALHVTQQETAALQTRIEIIDIGIDPAGEAGVGDLDIGAVEIDAGALRIGLDDIVTAEQDGGAEALSGEGNRRAHDLFFFGFRKNDPLRRAAHPLVKALCGRCHRVAAGGKLAGIGIEIGQLPAGDAGFDGGLRHGHRNGRDQARSEGNRNDVLRSEARAVALIGGGHIIRHIFAGEVRQRLCGSDLHRVVDLAGANIERTAEDIGEAEDIVDLVRVIRTARRHDGVVANA